MFESKERHAFKEDRTCGRDVPPRIFCPECGTELDPTCMKQNGTDNGEYYENYRCNNCCCCFTAVYDGKDDLSNCILLDLPE